MPIVLENVSQVYETSDRERLLALDGIHLRVDDGEFVTLVGPSGCGKSTLLNIVGGVLTPTSGTARVGSGDAGNLRPGMVFQSPVLLPWRTTLENVLLPAEVGPVRRHSNREHYRRRALELLQLVGLGGFEHRYPWELSGGMQQRVAIVRALLLESNILLLDEPFAALDEFTRERMGLELLKLWSRQRFTTLFVTHNIFEAVFLSDRVVVMTPRPGRFVGEVSVELPRPRTPDMVGSDAFSRHVREVRSLLAEQWGREVWVGVDEDGR